MTYRALTLEDAQFIAHRLALEMMDSEEEPIPPFNTRETGKLESCLQEPFQTFDGKLLHRSFVERVAVLFYLVTKNHCFENGNKRMAVTLTTVFCYINKKWINLKQEDLYRIACAVAKSKPEEMEIVVSSLADTFQKFTTELPKEFRVDKRKVRKEKTAI